MHNKSFTADNQATIIGGRNVGDEYFGAANGVLFTDLDVLAIGAAVQDVSVDFDRYWASDSAYPVARLLKPAEAGALDLLKRRADDMERSSDAAAYAEAMRALPFIRQLLKGELELEWAPTRMVSDDPRKTLGMRRQRPCCRISCTRSSANPPSRWTWCRPTSCPANPARAPSATWPAPACGCAC